MEHIFDTLKVAHNLRPDKHRFGENLEFNWGNTIILLNEHRNIMTRFYNYESQHCSTLDTEASYSGWKKKHKDSHLDNVTESGRLWRT